MGRPRKKRKYTKREKPIIDMVNHPPHYIKGAFETLDVIEDVVQFYEGSDAWSVGNVLRYVSRAPHKGNFVQDLQKAKFYMDNLLAQYVDLDTGELIEK